MKLQTLRKLLIPVLAVAFSATSSVNAQTVRINNVACDAGSTVSFGNNQINVSATGACVNPAPVVTPTLTALNPLTAAPGDTVTATGTNFAAGATVTVGGVAASVTSVPSATSLTFVVPSVAAASQSVIVTVNGQSSSGLTLTVQAATPVISSVVPSSGAPGQSVTINGTGFAAGATVTIGGTSAPVTSVTSTAITAIAPAIAVGTYPVVATVGSVASNNTQTFTMTAATPVITGINPTSAAAGATFGVSGTGFAPGATAMVGGLASTVVFVSPTQLTLSVPSSLASGFAYPVQVTVASISVNSPTALTVSSAVPAPTITACSGAVGGTFSITGTNFAAGQTTLTIGGNSVTTPTVNATTITGNVPAAITAAGSYNAIATVSGQASAAFSCTITAPPVGAWSVFVTSTDGFAIPFPSKAPSSDFNPTPVHSGQNGANGAGNPRPQNAWSFSTTSCSNTAPAISKLWVHNLNFPAYINTNSIEYFGLNPNEAISYAFQAPPEGSQNNFTMNESTYAAFVGSFMSISTTPCDFNVAKLNFPGRDYCYNSRNGSNTIGYHSTSGAVSGTACKLIPGQTYYLNYRNQDAINTPTQDSCQQTTGGAQACGGIIQLR